MARKRLNPTPFAAEIPGIETKSPLAPIAQVGSDAATQAALEEVSQELQSARTEGRLIQSLNLASIDKTHLVRDRVLVDDAEMAALKASLEARGQQTPIEVVETAPGRYGLISGWRRVTALEAIGATEVLALVRAPQAASDAYIAMVEENEIRVGLSYYERARIVLKALEQGIFADKSAALHALFASASKAKRSKIGGFMALVAALDGHLGFPAAIPERLGLPLARDLEADPGLGARLRAALSQAQPETAEAEADLLRAIWHPKPVSRAKPMRQELRPGVFLEASGASKNPSLKLSGPGIDSDFQAALEAWLHAKG